MIAQRIAIARAKTRVKCQPPTVDANGNRIKERWCNVLEAVLVSEPNSQRPGISVVQVMKLNTGKLRSIGVASRSSSKARPVMFNYCPFCKADLKFWKKK